MQGNDAMHIAVCDDERLVCDMIEEKIRAVLPGAVVCKFSSGKELLDGSAQPDILFLDIQMPGMDGMEAARLFRRNWKQTLIIFITAAPEYVFQAFDVGAFHYLVKPFDDGKFAEILQNAAKQLKESGQPQKASLLITARGEHIAVNIEDIVYAEVFDRKIVLHTMDGDIEYYGKMKELEKKAGDDFFRTHRAYLVNFGFVRKYDAAAVYLEKGQALMAKQNYSEFVKQYLKYNQRKAGR